MRTSRLKLLTVFFLLITSGSMLYAQSIDQGKKYMYYERYNSAQKEFNGVVSSSPGNPEAVYWLGQSMLATENVAGAKAIYQKALMANSNSPLLIAGMGNVELKENKTNDARQRFETAISLSKGKDINVLNAIGRANINSKAGDLIYAVEKLRMASDIKKNEETSMLLGDAYKKIPDGASAQMAYQDVLNMNPKNARASFMIGKLYQTQGTIQEPIYMKYYNDAMAADDQYSPVYEALSQYYYYRDINKAKEYLDKYIANADANSKNCYYQAAYLYASGKNQEAITKADECIRNSGNDVYPNLYGVKAYAYDKLNDSLNAKTNFDTYFQKQVPENLGATDYATYAKVLMKFPGNETLASTYIAKVINMDSTNTSKIAHIKEIANNFLTSKDYVDAGKWYTQLLTYKPDFSKLDLYNAGYNLYRADAYKTSDSVFALYTQKFPEDIFGWYMRAKASEGIDTSRAMGLANPYYEKVITIADTATDKEKVKQQLINAYRYMVAYYYNIKNDRPKALEYTEKILAVDPTDEQAQRNKEILSAPVKEKVKDNKVKVKTPEKKTKEKE